MAFVSIWAVILQIQPCFAQSVEYENEINLIEKGYHSQEPEELPSHPALADYERVLLTSNPTIRTAFAGWQAELKRIAYARGLPDPSINFGYFIQNVETAVGPQEYKLGIMQMIPWPGKLFVQGSIQVRKAEAAYQRLRHEIEDQLLDLRHLFYDAYYLERAIDITRWNLDLVKAWEKVIISRYRTGTARHANLVKTQIETIKLQDELETLYAGRQPLLAAFRALLNRSDIDRIHVPESLGYQPITYAKEEAASAVIENNPGLKEMLSFELAAGRGISRARMNYLPDFSIGIDKIFTGDRWNAAGQLVPESGKDPLVVMGSVSIPLWFYKQSAGIGVARHQKKKAGAQVEIRKNAVHVEFESIWFELEDAARKVILYGDVLIPKSLESLRSFEKAYAGDEADFLNLIDSQRLHLEFMLASEQALVRFHKARTRLEALTGRTL